MLLTDLIMVSTATVIRWYQMICRLALFVSDSCCGGNYAGDGAGNRSGGMAAMETEAVPMAAAETLVVGLET